MSRNIPTDQPLSDEDRLYLAQRGKMGVIEWIDRENAPKEESPGIVESPDAKKDEGDGGDTDDEFFDDDDDDDDDDLPAYENLGVPELKAELKRRGLSQDGKKDVLVKRLYDDDK